MCVSVATSYGGDSDDDNEWGPPQSTREDVEEDDNVGELMKEANSFISNNKM